MKKGVDFAMSHFEVIENQMKWGQHISQHAFQNSNRGLPDSVLSLGKTNKQTPTIDCITLPHGNKGSVYKS